MTAPSSAAARPPAATPEEARARCEESLQAPDLRDVAAALRGLPGGHPDCPALVASVTEAPAGQAAALEVAGALARTGYAAPPAALERYLLLRGALAVLDGIPRLPVPPRVRELSYRAFADLAAPPAALLPELEMGKYPFVALCKLASLRRFPAGQFDWEISGVPRSFFLKVRPQDLPGLAAYVAFRLGGRNPAFTPHFSIFRKHWLVMREREVNRSYYQMARAMELQPAVRGMVASSWFYARETYEVSPHLSWLRETIAANGGFASSIGRASAEGGVLEQSIRRRERFEAREFTPTEGLVLWSRDAMIRWAAEHPELGE